MYVCMYVIIVARGKGNVYKHTPGVPHLRRGIFDGTLGLRARGSVADARVPFTPLAPAWVPSEGVRACFRLPTGLAPPVVWSLRSMVVVMSLCGGGSRMAEK